jgi:AcrR family transcriptional regulator
MGQETQRRLLDAARKLVAAEGAGRLTLDAVAERAGVSKGGLLYHFPTKEALLKAMVGDLIEGFERRRDQALARLGADPAAALKAYVIANDCRDPEERSLAQALSAALVGEPELLAPIGVSIRQHVAEALGDASDPALGLVVCLAADGRCLIDALGLMALDEAALDGLNARLLELAERACAR